MNFIALQLTAFCSPASVKLYYFLSISAHGSNNSCLQDIRRLLENVPNPNYNLIKFLCQFLVKVSMNEGEWGTTDWGFRDYGLKEFWVQWNLPERPPLLSEDLTKVLIGSSFSQIAISETSHKWPPLLSDHLTKILIGSSIGQIAISGTSHKWPPLLSDHLTKVLTGSSVSQIAISETSHKWPPKSDIKGGCLQEVPLQFTLHQGVVWT